MTAGKSSKQSCDNQSVTRS